MPKKVKISVEFDMVKARRIAHICLWIALSITIICVFVPFSPAMPGADLDQSWVLGMNQAVAQGLAFGKDIIFTFGPYASIYTEAYHPATDSMMMLGSAYLAISFIVYMVALAKGVEWWWPVVLCFLLAGFIYPRDSLLFSIPLAASLVAFKLFFNSEKGFLKSRRAPLYILMLFAPLGLLPLIKGTMLILCATVVLLCSVFLASDRRWRLAAFCLLSPVISLLLFWHFSGQRVMNLLDYLESMVPIISGYTGAMAITGRVNEIIAYLVISLILFCVISFQKKFIRREKFYLLCAFFIFLFIAFKAGFVRHDGHALISSTSLAIAVVLLRFILKGRLVLLLIVCSLIVSVFIDMNYQSVSIGGIFNNTKSIYLSSWSGAKSRVEVRGWPKSEFDRTMASLREKASFPLMPGTTDIYSFQQTFLIASGNSWSPRPVFQSYSAYTSKLLEINRNHLLGHQAPDNIIFAIEPIDGRLPSIEDGMSWPVLLSNYRPERSQNNFLFLKKNGDAGGIGRPISMQGGEYVFGDTVTLPVSSLPLLAEIEIKPTVLGLISSLLFKSSELEITLNLKDGSMVRYRLIPRMAASPFMISPLIKNTNDFITLYGNRKLWKGKTVKSLTISSKRYRTLLWKKSFVIKFQQIPMNHSFDVSKLLQFDEFENQISMKMETFASKCEGSIDLINNLPSTSLGLSAFGTLRVDGWLAASVDSGTIPEATYVTLTDDRGVHLYLKTHVSSRPDVEAVFKKHELIHSGYSTTVDVSKLTGKYIVGLAMKMNGKTEICPNFGIPVTVAK